VPFALVTVLAVAANNASAQDTAPDAQHGPNQVAVTGLFPNGGAPPPQDPIGTRFEGNKLAIAAGKELFGQMNCSGCHFNGGGGMGPALMSGHWRYGGRIDQIYASIAQGRPNGMPSWQDSLVPTMMWDLAAYVKSLSAPAPTPSSTSETAAPATSVKP
jgi:cytochrome c oxidase cbb3-type subunit 3